MGLESVEFVMEIEEEFGLTIPDKDAEKLETIGLLHEYLIRRLGTTATPDNIWSRIKQILIEKHRIEPQQVQPHMTFVRDLGFD